MQTVSVRVPEDDLDWLSKSPILGSGSPSEKIRNLIAEARKNADGANDYLGSLNLIQGYLHNFDDIIRSLEHKEQVHSEVIESLSTKLPEVMATMISGFSKNDEVLSQAKEVEALVVAKMMQILFGLLRLTVTKQSATSYNPKLFDEYLPELCELVDLIKLVHPNISK